MEIMWKSRAKKAVGFCGGHAARKADSENARASVRKAISIALTASNKQNPELAQELRAPCRNRYPLPFEASSASLYLGAGNIV